MTIKIEAKVSEIAGWTRSADMEPERVEHEGTEWDLYAIRPTGYDEFAGADMYDVVLRKTPGKHDDALSEEFVTVWLTSDEELTVIR